MCHVTRHNRQTAPVQPEATAGDPTISRLCHAARIAARYLYWLVTLQLRRKLKEPRFVEILARSSWFDAAWYLQQYPDVAAAGIDPVVHFVTRGAAEGRKPNPLFDTAWYLQQNPDVAAAKVNPLVHYLQTGAAEGRAPNFALLRTFPGAVAAESVVFPLVDAPLVSIILPAYNHWQYTLWCLRSIRANSGDVPYEVIVADDGSTDDTRDIGKYVQNMRVVRHGSPGGSQSTLGFLRNCNRAATAARGKYLVFLNNDTLVQKGWLRFLVEAAQRDERVGLVGAKLLSADGQLQEAGGIIWRDGSGCNYGRGDRPARPQYNYLRETDYVSGAAMLVRHSLWRSIGGFDHRFAPAYYEDTDLAFESRKRGYKVVYQPQSVVIHFEGVSHGTDPAKGLKSYQVLHRQRFEQKWREVLWRDHFLPGEKVFLARDRRRRGRHLLFCDWELPAPDRDSGSVRADNLMQVLCSLGYAITFLPANLRPTQPLLERLQQNGILAVCGPEVGPVEEFLFENGSYFDVAIVSRVNVARIYMDLVRKYCPRAYLIFDTVDLHFLREQRQAELADDAALRKKARETQRQEIGFASAADLTLVVSTVEAELLRQLAPAARVRVVSNIHQIHGSARPFSERRDLLFIGSFLHTPNVDAVKWLADDIFPLIRRRLPGVRLYVIGSNPAPDVRARSCADLRVLGQVEDVAPFFNHCRLSLAPLRYGAGVKGKINMSMSYGLPVVSTSIGAEGMFLQDGVHALVADGPQGFADAVYRLYTDETLWSRVSQRGLENVQQYFSFDTAQSALRKILQAAQDHQRRQANSPRQCTASHTGDAPAERWLEDRGGTRILLGWCNICLREARFTVRSENLREDVICPHCGSTNRKRQMMYAFDQQWAEHPPDPAAARIWNTEAAGSFHQYLEQRFGAGYICSEYFGPEFESGDMVGGIRHEDLSRSSFPDDYFDMVLASDVLEHVPEPARAFAEVFRVLKPGGAFIFTVPFVENMPATDVLSEVQDDGSFVHHQQPVYHSDPLRPQGALVYRIFGEDIVQTCRRAGLACKKLKFSKADLGIVGTNAIVFVAQKAGCAIPCLPLGSEQAQ